MSILSGALTVRRFRVVGEVPQDFRELYRDQLNELAFKEPPTGQGREEVEGWALVHNLLDTDFTDFNRWLYDRYVLFSLRVDKKTLPGTLFAATLAKKCDEWAKEREIDRCPASVRANLKETLEEEWLARTFPRVATTEACWNINEGWLMLASHSESVAERFRKRFHRTFGLEMYPWSPLDWLDEPEGDIATKLLNSAPSLDILEAR